MIITPKQWVIEKMKNSSENAFLRLYPFKFKINKHKHKDLILQVSRYNSNNNLALIIFENDKHGVNGQPYMVASVNYLDDLPEDYVIIKNYSENEGILECLIENGFIKFIKKIKLSQFVEGDLCEFLM